MELSPAGPHHHNNLGLIYLDQNRVPEALAILEKGVAVQPDDAATLIHGADGNAVAITHRQILGLIARGDEGDPMIRNQSLLGPYGRWRVADPV